MTSTPTGPVLEWMECHHKDVGGLELRRALPQRSRRTVGAWCFFDHAGPAVHELKVGPHPHTGLQTFTWMIAGEILHNDSLGYRQVIRPGQVNLMTAGKGISHSEESLRSERLHAAQLWIALPEHMRHCEPDFVHYPQLPAIEHEGVNVTVLVGETFGLRAPTLVHTPLVALDLLAKQQQNCRLPLNPAFEHALLCLEGAVTLQGESLRPGTLLYLGDSREHLDLILDNGSRALLIGGEPFAEDLLVWWNFVGRTQDELAQAALDWNAHRHFDEVSGTQLTRLTAPDPAELRLKAPQ